jgi:hypothetical protein
MPGVFKGGSSVASSPSPSSMSPAANPGQNVFNDLNQSTSSKSSRKSVHKVRSVKLIVDCGTDHEILQEEGDDGFGSNEPSASVVLTPQYKELMRLVNQQRDKLGSLQVDLTKVCHFITGIIAVVKLKFVMCNSMMLKSLSGRARVESSSIK